MMILQHNACINGSCGIYAVFLNGLLWIYMGHVNWNGLMLDDQVNRFVGECWVSDVDAFVWWKVCEKHRKAERQVWSKTTERHTHMKAACSHTLVGITYRYQQFFVGNHWIFLWWLLCSTENCSCLVILAMQVHPNVATDLYLAARGAQLMIWR